MQPKKDPQDDMLERLRSSVGNVDRPTRSRATVNPLDPSGETEMGGAIRASNTSNMPNLAAIEEFGGEAGGGRVRARRPRRTLAANEEVHPPDLDDEDGADDKDDGEVVKLREERGKLRVEKAGLEKKAGTAEEATKKAKAELEEAHESIQVYEELVMSFTKKDEADVQEFADMVSEWKGKAKAFDQGRSVLEKAKQTEKELAEARVQLEAAKKKVQEQEAAYKTLQAQKGGASGSAALQTSLTQLQTKYDQARKDLDQAATKASALEQSVKARDKEIGELKTRLATTGTNNNTTLVGGSSLEDDPLIEMVEKLLKDMEEMARESEEYLAQVEKDLPTITLNSDHEEAEEESDDAPPMPMAGKPKPTSGATAKAPAVQQQPSAQPKK